MRWFVDWDAEIALSCFMAVICTRLIPACREYIAGCPTWSLSMTEHESKKWTSFEQMVAYARGFVSMEKEFLHVGGINWKLGLWAWQDLQYLAKKQWDDQNAPQPTKEPQAPTI